jgi:hypothetical protein
VWLPAFATGCSAASVGGSCGTVVADVAQWQRTSCGGVSDDAIAGEPGLLRGGRADRDGGEVAAVHS